MDRRSSSKSPTPEPVQSPSLREDEAAGGNIWHPLSRIKVESNQNDVMGHESEEPVQEQAETEAGAVGGGDPEETDDN